MLIRTFAAGAMAALALTSVVEQAEARIRCNGEFQIVNGHGQIATPYCEDENLARVARAYGIRVSGRVIRRSPSRKEEVCRAIGHDNRVYATCLKYRSEGCSGKHC